MPSDKAVAKAVVLLGDVFSREIKGPVLESYRLAVEPYSDVVLEGAIQRAILERNRCPAPADLRTLCREVRDDHRAAPEKALESKSVTDRDRAYGLACLAHMQRLRIGHGRGGGWAPGVQEAWMRQMAQEFPESSDDVEAEITAWHASRATGTALLDSHTASRQGGECCR